MNTNLRVRGPKEEESRRMSLRGLSLRLTAVCCLLSVGLVVSSGSAWAAPVAPGIEAESAVGVASTSAVLQAQIDPGGADTSYRFEYGTTEGVYAASVPVSDANAGAGSSFVSVTEHLQELQPSVVYHYRLVASNEVGTTDGPDRTFTTQPAGSPLVLPDERQWELVSPPNKDGAEVVPIGGFSGGGMVQASEDGSAISYLASAPVNTEPPGNGLGTQVLSRREPSTWTSQDISSPHEGQTGVSVGYGAEYQALSADLSRGIVQSEGGVANSGKKQTLVHDIGGGRATLGEAQSGSLDSVEFVGGTSDLGHVIYTYFGERKLFEWARGQAQPVSVLPSGEMSEGSFSQLGGVSADGSHVVWHTGFSFLQTLYDRDMITGETVQLDAPQGGSGSGGEGVFQAENRDGSKVFFTSAQNLTVDSTAVEQAPDLYEFVLNGGAGPLSGTLTDLTVDLHVGEHADVGVVSVGENGVLGASEDGSYIYFVAGGVLATGATQGAANLYELRESGGVWTTRFIAALTEADESDWSRSTQTAMHTARVSPNGRFVAFTSVASLTGYDNRDVNSGQPDPEVYLFDASSGRVVCGSCDPTGARPAGGSRVPGWTPTNISEALYPSRYLSNEGRLFFDSQDSIVPQDINGQEDVYEFEPNGVGDCHSAGDCVRLISGGAGPQGSSFLDASASGGDVFFRTSDQLVSQDFDTVFDVYDAHVCSTQAPCYATPPATPPACTTADSCRAAPSPQPAIYGAPASATFSGAGNVAPSTPSAVKTKGKVRKKPKKPRKRRARIKGRTGRSSGRAKSGRRQ